MTLEALEDLGFPRDLANLTVSYLRLSDYLTHGIERSRIYTRYKDRYDLSIPRRMFSRSVWFDRMHHPDSCAGVVFSAMCMFPDEQFKPFRRNLYICAFDPFSMRHHSQCNESIIKLLCGTENTLSTDQKNYLDQHFATDWTPRFDSFIETLEDSEFSRSGLDYIISHLLLAIVRSRHMSDQIKIKAMRYITESLACEDLLFAKKVYRPCRSVFKEIYLACELFYSEDPDQQKSMESMAGTLQSHHSYSHTQALDVLLLVS